MNCPYVIKVCTNCNRILVANSGNFHKAKTGKYGLRGDCKRCNKQWRENNKKHIAEYYKQYRENNKEHYAEYYKQYYKNNKESYAEYSKEYYQDNKEYFAEYMKEYRENNKESIAEHSKQYRENNKESIAEHKKQYYQNNPHIFFNNANKRRSREENQGNGINKEQWLEMMEFFNWCCAYSGEYIGGENNKSIRSIDHIVPLAEGGENEIWNCVPMLKGYNSSKWTNDMLQWYEQQDFYSDERLEKIYAWCEYAYNKWYSEQII